LIQSLIPLRVRDAGADYVGKIFGIIEDETYLTPDSYISWLTLNYPEADLTVFSTETSLLDFFPETTPLDAIAVCDDSSNTEVAKIEDPTSIGTTPDEAITPGGKNRLEIQLLGLLQFPQMVEAAKNRSHLLMSCPNI